MSKSIFNKIKSLDSLITKKDTDCNEFNLLHSSNGSSELSPQSSSTSHFQLWGMQRPLRHLNCPGRQVLVEQWAGSSSERSPQSSSPSHCHDSGIHRLFAHCHWWFSHWCVAERKTSCSVDRDTWGHKKCRHVRNYANEWKETEVSVNYSCPNENA